ncbi:hypothetical protein PoB_007020900 [Plakobranchus ocellatus]|uniref:Uncharacterized protein n=1 Tax=Plakobranchus ocellatus TaxID=259542 RepID=A0AAV4DHQ4_9GAST|nr:hypothetical protein PoB_007020900 [Plakobranchus ocellatus]
MTSRLGSVGQRCPPVSGEVGGQGGMLMSDSHYCRAVTTSTSRIHPFPHTDRTSRQTRRPHCGDSTWEEKEVEDSRRRGRRDDSAGKEVGIEDKSQVEKEMSPCPEREAVHRRQPALVVSYDSRQPRWSQSSPGPTRGQYLVARLTLVGKNDDTPTMLQSFDSYGEKMIKSGICNQVKSFSHLDTEGLAGYESVIMLFDWQEETSHAHIVA